MNVEQILFYFFGVLVLGSALLVVSMQNLVRSIFLFFVTLFSLAALYVFALADFVALTQVVIYVGGGTGINALCIYVIQQGIAGRSANRKK